MYKTEGSEIIIAMRDEIFAGTLPMVTGRTCRYVERPSDIREEGPYIWAGKRDLVMREIEKIASMEIVLEKKIGIRSARLAFIKPREEGLKKPEELRIWR